MALQQIIQHETGTYSQYWKVSKTDINYMTNEATITLIGYVSEDARIQQKTPLDNRVITASGVTFGSWFTPGAIDPQDINPVKNSYLYVKSIPDGEFAGATNV